MMFKALKQKLGGLASSVARFPATMTFLLASAVLTAVSISGEEELTRFILTGIVGAVSCAACQSLYERFFSGAVPRIVLYIAGIIVTGLFYLSIHTQVQDSPEMITRLAVVIFALMIAFIWFGVIRGPRDFGESFMATFKALFEAAFFSGVLFLGCSLIIAAVNRLITPIDEDAYRHTANIVFKVIAPLIFLSLIPVYPGKGQSDKLTPEQHAVIDRRTGCPKFLEVLLSYIIIPLTDIFTVILLIYILLNIGGEFWTNNLLEPMLIAYTITVIVVTILVAHLKNRIAEVFVKVFPKVMIPIALFQIVASVLLLRETGMTYGRYYVLLYGVFAVFSGIALFTPRRKIGIIAPVLIALSVISLVPPVDAFTVSRSSQIYALEQTLTENGMLSNNAVTPNDSISDADKETVAAGIRYLGQMEDLDEVSWLPDGFKAYDDAAFFSTFGFHMYSPTKPGYQFVNVYYDSGGAISVTGFDIFAQVYFPNLKKTNPEVTSFDFNGKEYVLSMDDTDGNIVVKDEVGGELIRFDTREVFDRYASYSSDKSVLTPEEATFVAENDRLLLKIVVLSAAFSKAPAPEDTNAQLYVFIDMK